MVDKVRTLAFFPVTGSILGLGETGYHSFRSLDFLVRAAFKSLQELYYYSRGNQIRLWDIQFEKTAVLSNLSYHVSCVFRGIITIVPVLGGYIRNRREDNVKKGLELLEEGKQVFSEKKFDIAFSKFKESASYGNAEANFRLHFGLRKGFDQFNIKKSLPDAMKHIQTAAKKQFPLAYHQLGVIYQDGFEEIKPNDKLALSNYLKGAFLKSPVAQEALGEIYFKGWCGQKVNKDFALYWYEKGLSDSTNFQIKMRFGLCKLESEDKKIVRKGLSYLEETLKGLDNDTNKNTIITILIGMGNAFQKGIKRSVDKELANEFFKAAAPYSGQAAQLLLGLSTEK